MGVFCVVPRGKRTLSRVSKKGHYLWPVRVECSRSQRIMPEKPSSVSDLQSSWRCEQEASISAINSPSPALLRLLQDLIFGGWCDNRASELRASNSLGYACIVMDQASGKSYIPVTILVNLRVLGEKLANFSIPEWCTLLIHLVHLAVVANLMS